MGYLYVFDGPEKSGKTTIIREVNRQLNESSPITSQVVKWGPVDPDDRVYTNHIANAVGDSSNTVTLWDRSWAAEHVYARMLNRDRRLRGDPWLGEWLHGRAVHTMGRATMIFAPNTQFSIEHRDVTDLDVDPVVERYLFHRYAQRFGWRTLKWNLGDHPQDIATAWIREVLMEPQSEFDIYAAAPWFAGPTNSPVIVVGENRGSGYTLPGGLLPFTSRYTTEFGRLFGDNALRMSWTNAHECPSVLLLGRKLIITCGEYAHHWVRNFFSKRDKVRTIKLAHPSYVFRYGKKKKNVTAMLSLYQTAVDAVTELFKEKNDGKER